MRAAALGADDIYHHDKQDDRDQHGGQFEQSISRGNRDTQYAKHGGRDHHLAQMVSCRFIITCPKIAHFSHLCSGNVGHIEITVADLGDMILAPGKVVS